MPSRQIGGVRFDVYPNDHHLPHVHGFSDDTEVIVQLLANGNVRLADRNDAAHGKRARCAKCLRRRTTITQNSCNFGSSIMAALTRNKQIQDAIKAGHEHYKRAVRTTRVKYVPGLDVLVLNLSNGTRLVLPREQLQDLHTASRKQIANVELLGGGTGLHWPDLDADLWVEGLVNGVYGTKQWMSQVGRLGGSVRSKAKTDAARLNGLKGGRPPKPDSANPSLPKLAQAKRPLSAVKTVANRKRLRPR